MASGKSLASLYIHWPFCKSRCSYCDFIAFSGHEDFQERYHNALIKEIENYAQSIDCAGDCTGRTIKTIFIGGGTPSLYPLDFFQDLSHVLAHNFDLTGLQEFTIETNPVDITEEKLDVWASCGVNRLSMGVQVLDDNVLMSLNRRQRTGDVYQAMRMIPKYFKNISIDLIIGLPGVSSKAWGKTIQTALSWPITHISLYFLTVYDKTPLYFSVQKGTTMLPQEQELLGFYKKTRELFCAHGFQQYEISNFAKPGYESVHNQVYWNHQFYKGFGLGAASFLPARDGCQRIVNEKNLLRYLDICENNSFNLIGTPERVSFEQEKLEKLMLGLRQTRGVDLHRMVYLLEEEEKEQFLKKLAFLTAHSLITEDNGKIRLTAKGMLLENEVIVRLM